MMNMMKKFSVLCVYAVATMMALVSCSDDEPLTFDSIETIQRGYFREVVKPKDVDRLFKQHGLTDLENYKNRWCASIGDSLEVFTSFNVVTSRACIELFLNKQQLVFSGGRFDSVRNVEEGEPLKLDPDKPFFLSADGCKILLPMIYKDGTHYIYTARTTSPRGNYDFGFNRKELIRLNEDGSYYMYDADKNLYYLLDLYGKREAAAILPECLGDSIMSAKWSLYSDLDFENDGEFSFAIRNPATGEKYYQKSLHVTREAMQELRDNGGRVARKSLSYKEYPGSRGSFQLVLEFPNHHVYKYTLNREKTGFFVFGNEWRTYSAEIEHQGKSYVIATNLIEYSDLDCLVLIPFSKITYDIDKGGKFWQLTLGLENPEQSWSSLEWRFYNGEEESKSHAYKKHNYKVGQNGALLLGYSSIFADDFLSNGDNYYGLIAYDQECPNCLGKKDGGCRLSVDFHKCLATCSECKRVYDLNAYGVIVDGDEGKRLICYRHGETDFDDELRKKSGIEEAGLLIYGRL